MNNVKNKKSTAYENLKKKIISGLLQPGEALNKLQYNAIASGYIGSGTCKATGGDAKIAGVVNEAKFGGTTDTLMTYEGINITTP